ncbi:MAG: 5'-deoxynucleotidase [Clostridia bacterium]|nr:5'-deoxynucleotidase [Clostridia bacterium]
MSSHFYAFLSRMKYINRWALMRNTSADTLSQHSHEVAAIAYVLCVIGNRRYGRDYNGERAALLGLFHDMPEIITGDLPTPVKYFNPEIKEAYKKVEAVASEKLLATLPEDLRADFEFLFDEKESDETLWKIVKAADKLSALVKCIEERKAGNMEFAKAEQSTFESIKNMNMPEADDFIKDFLPAYELTLDQLT